MHPPAPGAPPPPGLVLREVSFAYGRVLVVDEESIDVPTGGLLVVTGENGVGKSTLLHLAAGLLEAQGGSVWLDGHRPDVMHPSALFQQGVRRGFVFQQGGLLSNLSALGNVTLALRYHADVLGLSAEALELRASEALERVGLGRTERHALPAHLSLGVRKRIAIARALALQPNFMFFDDPDSGLDVESAALVSDLLVECRDDLRITMAVATNHRALIQRLDVSPFELAAGKLLARASRFLW